MEEFHVKLQGTVSISQSAVGYKSGVWFFCVAVFPLIHIDIKNKLNTICSTSEFSVTVMKAASAET